MPCYPAGVILSCMEAQHHSSAMLLVTRFHRQPHLSGAGMRPKAAPGLRAPKTQSHFNPGLSSQSRQIKPNQPKGPLSDAPKCASRAKTDSRRLPEGPARRRWATLAISSHPLPRCNPARPEPGSFGHLSSQPRKLPCHNSRTSPQSSAIRMGLLLRSCPIVLNREKISASLCITMHAARPFQSSQPLPQTSFVRQWP
jgi:hypothetical protein